MFSHHVNCTLLGDIPRATCMDPEFLSNIDGLAKWIQHFDGTRGCHICIVDMPAVKTSEVALWRRLLLGEGDGFAPRSIKYSALLEDGMAALQSTNLDEDSPFKELEVIIYKYVKKIMS